MTYKYFKFGNCFKFPLDTFVIEFPPRLYLKLELNIE